MFETVVRLTSGLLLVAANAFFVVTEFALTRLAEAEPEELEDDPRLERAREMIGELEIHLTGCQLGITSTTLLLGVVTEPAVSELLEPLVAPLGFGEGRSAAVSVVVAVVLLNLVHKIWGEQAPTYLGIERPREVARITAPILSWWSRVFRPVIMAGDGLAKATLRSFGIEISRSWTERDGDSGADDGPLPLAELRRVVTEHLGRSELSRERRREVVRSLEIEAVPVREIMVAREDVVALSGTDPWEDALGTLKANAFVRYPLVGASLDEPEGVVYVPSVFPALDDLRSGSRKLAELAAEPVIVDPDLSVSELIDVLQEERQELAFVAREGRTLGIVTATDAFEAIAGEMEDPLDDPRPAG